MDFEPSLRHQWIPPRGVRGSFPGAEAQSEAGAEELGAGPGARMESVVGMRGEKGPARPGGVVCWAGLEPSPWWLWGPGLKHLSKGSGRLPSATERGLSGGSTGFGSDFPP